MYRTLSFGPVVRTAGWIVACAAAPALIASALIQHLNDLNLSDAAVVTLWLWQLFACALAGPLVLTVLLLRLMRRRCCGVHLIGVTLAGLFGLLWFSRLEPAHQVLSIRPHLSSVGTMELCLIAAACAGILGAVWRFRGAARPLVAALAVTVSVAAISATAKAVEPTRDRTRFVTRLTTQRSSRARAPNPPARVLVIGVDGMDWKPLEWLIRAGRLPTLASLLDRGRFYQLDNRKMAISPQIWTALYTGYPQRANAIGGFEEWQFGGASRPVYFLPHFGVHPIWMLDALLDHFNVLGGWDDRPSSTLRIRKPPVWTIASESGRRVGIFDPVPYFVIGERVNGFFAWPSQEGFSVSRRVPPSTQSTITHEPLPTNASKAVESIDPAERARAELATRAFADVQPDFGVYYTHFIDSLSHFHWDFRFPSGWFGGDPRRELDARFASSSVAQGYIQADAEVRDLIAAFGAATVVLVSDHGWDFDDYEHFLSPYGVLIVAGTGATGYGGVADVLSVTPTILSLLHLPVATDMQPALADVTAAWGTSDGYSSLHQDFVLEDIVDPDRRELLRSLGYLHGR